MPKEAAGLVSRVYGITRDLISFVINTEEPVHYVCARNPGQYPFDKDIKGLMQQALNELNLGSSPIFIAFIPCAIADTYACKNGFLDSCSGGSFKHGKFTHATQIYCQIIAGSMEKPVPVLNMEATKKTDYPDELQPGVHNDRKTKSEFIPVKDEPLHKPKLKEIIDDGFWAMLFDQDTHTYPDCMKLNGLLPLPTFITGFTPAFTFNNPFNLHELLSTGTLSKALIDLNLIIQHYGTEFQIELLEKFAQRMGVKEITLEALNEMAFEINALESIYATKHRRSIDKIQIAEPTTPCLGFIDDEEAGVFIENEETKRLINEKAKKYFDKGDIVIGICRREQKGSCERKTRHSPPTTVKNRSNIDDYNCFVVYISETPLQ